jgi:hypothetical protein
MGKNYSLMNGGILSYNFGSLLWNKLGDFEFMAGFSPARF